MRGDGEDHCENLLSSFRDLLARSETCRDGSQTEVPFLNCDVRFPPDSDQTADIEQGRGRAKTQRTLSLRLVNQSSAQRNKKATAHDRRAMATGSRIHQIAERLQLATSVVSLCRPFRFAPVKRGSQS